MEPSLTQRIAEWGALVLCVLFLVVNIVIPGFVFSQPELWGLPPMTAPRYVAYGPVQIWVSFATFVWVIVMFTLGPYGPDEP